jgi:6-phosphogluconolactonase
MEDIQDRQAVGDPPTIRVVADPSLLAGAAEAIVSDAVLHTVERRGRCAIALAGGGTPRALYERLAADDATRLPWGLVDVWFGDERCVPPNDAASNYGMARDALLSRVPIPASNVHRIQGELGAAAAAELYDAELRAAFGPVTAARAGVGGSSFDVVLLGVGTEGHTASLFPGHPALDVTDRWAAPVDPAPPTAVPQVPRVTVTLPALNAAAEVLVLATGAEKRFIIDQVRAGTGDLPAARVRGRERTMWIVDSAAG